MHRDTAGDIKRKTDVLLADPAFRERVAHFRGMFTAYDPQRAAVLVTDLLAGREVLTH
jgi:hypothetical protein